MPKKKDTEPNKSRSSCADPSEQELNEQQLRGVVGCATDLTIAGNGDDVLIAFKQGEIRSPIVLGGLWSGKKIPPS